MSSRTAEIEVLRRRLAVLEGRLPQESQMSLAPAPAASIMQEPTHTPSGSEVEGAAGVCVAPAGQSRHRLCLGVEELDQLSAQHGFKLGTLHEFTSTEVRQSGALTGFVAALATLCLKQRDGMVLWVLDEMVQREAGLPSAQGFLQFGLDPARLLIVAPHRVEEVLWALEEGSQCRALSVVVGEMQGDFKSLDLTATRRLALRSERSGVPVFLMRHSGQAAVSAAMTRWRVTPLRSEAVGLRNKGAFVPARALMAAPCWHVELEKNRDGRPGSCELEWNHAEQRFKRISRPECGTSLGTPAPEATHPVSMVPRAGHRPHLPQGSGQVVALRRRG
ncbi:inducible mutagenesis protein A [Pseudovibrio exalbescens]|uniref:ImuA family protein n=1 Tax=Pseudovibrio exalbescens TaxID=197461 RepID=UPI00236633C6|nr:inducible mutagenesis protein A [Pseudovibrio exalbescens]MDD7909372.1 inducible mutagenesis protein A [Pseudovibrio exalbescens]